MTGSAVPVRATWLVLSLSVALLALGIVFDAWPFMADDAFISLRYSERLVQGHGLTWTDGERVEGYSNLLWVLLVSALGAFGIDWVAAARALGIACTVATFGVLLFGGVVTGVPAVVTFAMLGAIPAVAAWAIGGLEAPLAMLLVALAMVTLQRSVAVENGRQAGRYRTACGIALALLAWTRPDGPLWALPAGLVAFWFGREGPPGRSVRAAVARAAPIAVPVAVAVVAQLAFRLVYYGDWLPNTAHVKLASLDATWQAGVEYLWSGFAGLRPLVVAAGVGLLLLLLPVPTSAVARPANTNARRAGISFALVGTFTWCAYLVSIGGDPFPRWRLLLPVLAPLALLAAQGVARMQAFGGRAVWLAWALALGSVAFARWDASFSPALAEQKLTLWEWEGEGTGLFLRDSFGTARPLLAVDAAGSVPFFSGLPCLDMLGLCDRQIALSTPTSEIAFWAGHNRGDGRYVLDRAPDLVLFGGPMGHPQPLWLSGRQMETDPRFLRDYRMVLFDTDPWSLPTGAHGPLRVTTWLRIDGRLGFARDGSKTTIPGYWLGCYRQPYPFRFRTPPPPEAPHFAQWQADVALAFAWYADPGVVGVHDAERGRVVGEVRRAGTFTVPHLALAPGAYSIEVPGLSAGVVLSLTSDGAPLEVANGAWQVAPVAGDPMQLRLVDLTCVVSAGVALPVRVPEFVLQRTD